MTHGHDRYLQRSPATQALAKIVVIVKLFYSYPHERHSPLARSDPHLALKL